MMMTRDGGMDAAEAGHHPNDAQTADADSGGGGMLGGGDAALDADSGDAADPEQDAASDGQAADADVDTGGEAGMSEAGTPEAGIPDASDSGGTTDSDGSSGADAGDAEAGLPPLDCAALVRTGVQLCDMTADSCGAVFTNSSGCTATCGAAGLACETAYENVENQCARDTTRPAIACDSGHQSDYCLCRRR
jgi:hypothetical protein